MTKEQGTTIRESIASLFPKNCTKGHSQEVVEILISETARHGFANCPYFTTILFSNFLRSLSKRL